MTADPTASTGDDAGRGGRRRSGRPPSRPAPRADRTGRRGVGIAWRWFGADGLDGWVRRSTGGPCLTPSWSTSRSPTGSRRSPWTPRTTATRCPGSWSPSCSDTSRRRTPTTRSRWWSCGPRARCSARARTSPRPRARAMEEGARAMVRMQRQIVALGKPVVTRRARRGARRWHRHRRRLRHRHLGGHHDVRADRGEARPGACRHLAHRAAAADLPGGRAHLPRRRGVRRHPRRRRWGWSPGRFPRPSSTARSTPSCASC